MDILFLSNRPAPNTQARTVTDYLDAFQKYSRHRIFEISMLHDFPRAVRLEDFDAVLIHYSLSIGPMLEHYLGPRLPGMLSGYRGLKAIFIQDEYREIATYWKRLRDLGIDVIFTCVPDAELEKVYPQDKLPGLLRVNVLTGYVPDSLLQEPVPPISRRTVDVGYRTRKTPYWLGELGYEKWRIAEEFECYAAGTGLTLDVSYREGDRLYGKHWTDFVANCRAMLGVESGASIIDFDGRLERVVDEFCRSHPDATFAEVHRRFMTEYEGSLRLHQISPRCFEAIALRTPLVLFEGGYSGVLVPDRHYIPLRKDFGNISGVIAKLKDHRFLQELADRAYQEVALDPRWSYRTFVERVDQVMEDELAGRGKPAPQRSHSKQSFRNALLLSPAYQLKRRLALMTQRVMLGVPAFRRGLFGLWDLLPLPARRLVRPLVRVISR
jgi:hypothetical protein